VHVADATVSPVTADAPGARPEDAPATGAALVVVDDDGTDVVLDADEAAALLALTGGLDDATVSACPDCHSRTLACLALVDVLDAAAPHPRAGELVALAEDAPTSHCYVVDLAADCRHPQWRDPGFTEWFAVVVPPPAGRRPPRR